MPKFRTMTYGLNSVSPHVTRLGMILRRHRLDELPQLVSVLIGHMSLVGPRPELTRIVATYDSRHRRRLSVRAGVTGLWQLRGSRRKPIHEEIEYDLYYLRRASACLDAQILAATVLFMLAPRPWQV